MTSEKQNRPVLLDLGGTIIDYSRSRPYLDWEGVALEAITPFLEGRVPRDRIASLAHAYREAVLVVSRAGPANPDIPSVWRAVLREWNVPLEEAGQEGLIDAYCRRMSDGWVPFGDAFTTLEALRGRGHPLALVSNVYEPAGYWRAFVARLGLAPFFDALAFSSEVGWQKPDRRIFEHALAALGHTGDGAVFVGDDLQADVHGASQMGMTTVWVRTALLRRERLTEPTHEIASLSDLLGILDSK